MIQNDLPLSCVVPQLNLTDSDGRIVRIKGSGKPEIIVFVGACSSCNKESILRWTEFHNRVLDVDVFLVSSDEPERVKEFLRAEQIDTVMLCDRGGVAAKTFNAFWFPRSYLIDEHGRLIYAQPDSATDQKALLAIEQILRERVDEPFRPSTRHNNRG